MLRWVKRPPMTPPSDYKLITILSIAIILNTATDVISRIQLDHKLSQQTHKHQQPTHCNQTTQTIQNTESATNNNNTPKTPANTQQTTCNK